MKNLLFFIFLSLNLVAQKSPKDVVDFNNFDYTFAESLLHEKFNSELVKISENHKPLRKDSVAYKAMEYQLNNFKDGGEFSHTNKKPYRNVLLVNHGDRIDYFFKKTKYGTSSEVLSYNSMGYEIRDTTKKQYYIEQLSSTGRKQLVKAEKLNDGKEYYFYDRDRKGYVYIDDSQITYSDQITYEYIVEKIFNNLFINSNAHRIAILSASKKESFSYWKIEYKISNGYLEIWSGSVFYE